MTAAGAVVSGLRRTFRSWGLGVVLLAANLGVAALLAALVLGERLAPPERLGCALMLAAMVVLFLAERRTRAGH